MSNPDSIWAVVPTGDVVPLPATLVQLVQERGPDPLRWRLSPTADAAAQSSFQTWRAHVGTRLRLGTAHACELVNAELARAGQRVLTPGRTYDAAATSHLWLIAQEAGLTEPEATEFVENMGRVVALCVRRGRHMAVEQGIEAGVPGPAMSQARR